MTDSIETKAIGKSHVDVYESGNKGRNAITEYLRDLAISICRAQDLPADTDKILFVMDKATKRRRRYSASDIKKIPEDYSDIIFQLTGYRFEYIVKFWEANLSRLCGNQTTALLYHELRHIRMDKEGKLFFLPTHDIEDWPELSKFGDWEGRGAELPDLLSEKIEREDDGPETFVIEAESVAEAEGKADGAADIEAGLDIDAEAEAEAEDDTETDTEAGIKLELDG